MAQRTIGAWIRQALRGHGTAAAGPRIGTPVTTNEGSVLGTLTALWQGTAATDGAQHEDTLVVDRPGQGAAELLYIPSSAIARVSDQNVVLTVDEAQVIARGWRHRPAWLPQQAPAEVPTSTD